MIRIAKNRCGYREYTCIGVNSLTPAFAYTKMISDLDNVGGPFRSRDFEPAFDFSTEDKDKWNYIDNYLNIPTKYKGFVMSTDHILDMSGAFTPGSIESITPELSCRTDFDPFSDTGFLDLYNTLYYSLVDARTFSDKNYVLLSNMLLSCIKNEEERDYGDRDLDEEAEEGIFEPGILEPMLATSFSPVDIDGPTAVDTNMDAVISVLVSLTTWRIDIEKRLNKKRGFDIRLDALLRLIEAKNKQSICDNFKIYKVSGTSLLYGTDSKLNNSSPPKYDVSNGTVTLNGHGYSVTGLSNLIPPFYVYVNGYSVSQNTIRLSMDTTKGAGAIFSVGIGGVKVSTGKSNKKQSKYRLYEIVQERCHVNIGCKPYSVNNIPVGAIVLGIGSSGVLLEYPTGVCPDPLQYD